MPNRPNSLKASALAFVAAALVGWAPIASADDPQSCDQQPPEQQQQCQQQQAAGIANQVTDNVQQGVQQVQQWQKGMPRPNDPSTGKPFAGRGIHLILGGVETCWPAGVPGPIGAKQEPVPGDMTGEC
jgi:hypothetical protein